MPWECFVAPKAGKLSRKLRRYKGRDHDKSREAEYACPNMPGNFSYHDAKVRIEDTPDLFTKYVTEERVTPEIRLDPRWPTHCSCGYTFVEDDIWQVFTERLYTNPKTGEVFPIREAPPGAIFFADWLTPDRTPINVTDTGYNGHLSIFYYREWYGKRDPLLIQCPGRNIQWCPDSPSTNGPGWQIVGEIPKITITPSILLPNYHGWVTDGFFTDDIEGRTYE
jgi:hypothetical protein